MATSRCPQCTGSKFEMVETDVSGSRFRIMFIQCQSCGTVVGTMNYENASYLVRVLAEKLGVEI